MDSGRVTAYRGQMQFDAEIDASGLLCPLPVLKARKRLLAMPPGAVLKVLATDPVAVVDMPHFCGEAGHDFLDAIPEGAATAFYIRRGKVQAD